MPVERSFLACGVPRRRDDLLLSGAIAAIESGDLAGALVAIESVCRSQPDNAAPAILRAKLLGRVLPSLTAQAWHAAWIREPDHAGLQDALLQAWLLDGQTARAASLGLGFLPRRQLAGTQRTLLPLLRRAGLTRFGACWKDADGITAAVYGVPEPGSGEPRARLQVQGPTAVADFDVPADGRPFRIPHAGHHGVWSLALDSGDTVQPLAGSPLSYVDLPSSPSPAQPGRTTTGVIIVIPVYRGFEQARQCIDSVLASLPVNRAAASLLVIDDASPEPVLQAWLGEHAAAGRLTLIRNRHNLGFIESVNRALSHCGGRDVLLLNADTLVHGDWIDRLCKAAYAEADIAAVSPWSNNGEITSFPAIAKAAPSPDADTLRTVDDAAAALHAAGDTSDVDLPACCGFAMLMRRDALDDIGPLDGKALQRGYGEEVDWCLRARAAGYRIRAATGVFVGHVGGVSFGDEKRLRVRENRAVIAARYPDYYAAYQRFLRSDPLQAARGALGQALAERLPAGHVAAPVAPALPWHALDRHGTWIAAWQCRPGTPFAAAILRLARLLAMRPAAAPRVRLLVFGHATEALWHTGVVDAVRPAASDDTLLDDSAVMRLAGCTNLLAAPGQVVPAGIDITDVGEDFDPAGWLAGHFPTSSLSPMPARPHPGPRTSMPRWTGAIDAVHDNLLYGWALDRDDAQARVVLEIRYGDDVIATTVADQARFDLDQRFTEESGSGADNCHGFVVELPAFAAESIDDLTVAVANTEFLLPGKPIPAAVPPPTAASNVSGDGGLRPQGWLLPASPGAAARTVYAWSGQAMVAQATANRRLPAFRDQPGEACGFQLDLPLDLADGKRHEIRILDQDGKPLHGSPVTVCCHAGGSRALLEAGPTVVQPMLEMLERLLPRGLGMAHYATWADRFEATPSMAASALRVGLIVTGGGNATDLARTLASLARQTHRASHIFSGERFEEMLGAALDTSCDVIGCVRSGDRLPPNALALALEGFQSPQALLVYADSETAGQPWFKPAWNRSYALATDCALELMLARAGTAAEECAAGMPRHAADLAWRLLARADDAGDDTIVHVPRVLYEHVRPLDPDEQRQRHAAAAGALAGYDSCASLAVLPAAPAWAGLLPRRIRRELPAHQRARHVTLIIPVRDHPELLRRCIDSIERHTHWQALDIVVIDNGSVLPESHELLAELARRGITVLDRPGTFNFAALNNEAVALARGEIVGLVNNDVTALHDGWLDEMVAELLQPGVAAVGAKLLWPNGMVQHGGVLLGIGNAAGHYGTALADDDWGDHWRNRVSQQVSAVTAACMLLHKADYLAVGGMDADAFPVAFNDVDLCLKLRMQGKSITWTPFARMQHAESVSRGRDDTPQKRSRALRELARLRQRWGSALLCDPSYHPSLALDMFSPAFDGLAMPPRPRAPRVAQFDPAGAPCA